MHAIRLRGPWEFSIGGTSIAGRIEFPCSWRQLCDAAGSQADAIRLTRRFNKPTGLQQRDSVLLSFRYCGAILTAQLNGASLSLRDGPDGSQHAEVTSQLADRNELIVEFAPPSPALLATDDCCLDVELQIHSARES
ncbi:MAG: hypothetical protein ACREUU_01790 [Gammaproteobacteria bacterium]